MPLVPPPPMVLPKAASTATTSTWLLGTRNGFREVPTSRARLVARRMGDRLTFAEPNVERVLTQVAEDPYTPLSRWRERIIDPALTPPEPTALLALVDAKADVGHKEFRGGRVSSPSSRRVKISHGTATLGVAAAPVNGVGIVGAYPGARAVNIALPSSGIRCADSARGIRGAIRAGARVISMSYGSVGFCQAEYEALQLATRRGITLVAAGGNERTRGNPYEFPASLPHVITVGALDKGDPAFFSNTSAALDLTAPGVGIVAPVLRDRYARVSGTSFSTPMVAGAATWLRTVRPDLAPDQVANVLRTTATDVGARGYDVRTGYGRLNLAGALTAPAPTPDPMEPNEDFRFVDGRAFSGAAAPIWRGGTAARLRATVDLFEDPADVYRIRIPARGRAAITVKPESGNADLDVYAGGSPTINSRRGLIRRSRRTGTKTDRVTVRNVSGRSRAALVLVYQRGRRPANSAYALTVR